MKYEQKIIEAAIEELKENEATPLGAPTTIGDSDCDPVDCDPVVKSFSYRELTKVARSILFFTAENFNALFKEQGFKDTPKIEAVRFIEFSLGSQNLVGMFKVSYENKNQFPDEGVVYASWNGNGVKVY